MATVAEKNNKWYAVFYVQDEHGNRKQKWISTGLPSKNGKANKTAAKKIANQIQEKYDTLTLQWRSISGNG